MIWSASRPSDDSLTIGYNDSELSNEAAAIGVAVRAGIERYGPTSSVYCGMPQL
jgi:hypothetical protein